MAALPSSDAITFTKDRMNAVRLLAALEQS